MVDSEGVAAELSRGAVRVRLAACGQVSGPIVSTYWWEGKVDSAREWTVVFKTEEAVAPSLIEHLVQRHPYDVPEVLITPVLGGNPAYLEWVAAQTRDG